MVRMGQNVRVCGDNARPNFPRGLIGYSAGVVLGVVAGLAPWICHAAEFGTGPWLKGYSDIFAGIVPAAPGFYFRGDAYHYEASAGTLVFNGRVSLDVDQDMTASLFALTYVTPWKFLGGTYAIVAAPAVMANDVNVGIGLPAFTGPRGRTFEPIEVNVGDTNLALGDTAFAPLVLGWDAGNFHWNFSLFGLAPTGDYDVNQLANTSLNHWAIMPRLGATYFDPRTGWQLNGVFVYSWSFKNPETEYETGQILNLEGSVVKNFGPLGLGAVGYAMIQTTGDSGAGARLGSFESRVYGIGPILTFTTSADPNKSLTVLVKGYHEFDAEHTFEGNVVDVAASFKF